MNPRKTYCFALNLVDDPEKIAEYERHHEAIWPEVLNSFKEAGIVHLDMYRQGTRVVMVMEVNEQFSFEKKQAIDVANPVIQKWETLMSQYQQAAPGALAHDKWILLKQIAGV